MGKLTKSLQNSVGTIMCGTKYQKFDQEQDLDFVPSSSSGSSNSSSRNKELYNCSECGHVGVIVKTCERTATATDLKVLKNNNLNNLSQTRTAFRRSTSDLLLLRHHSGSGSANVTCLVNNLRSESSSCNNGESLAKRLLLQVEKKTANCQSAVAAGCSSSNLVSARDDLEQLRAAAWYQPGLSRDISVEVLSPQPTGSFLIRCSESRPDAFALSLKVPNQSVVHYLVISNCQGWKIKGSTKCFPSLSSLIVHHSVMSELLPCALLELRNDHLNKSFDSSVESFDDDGDFADVEDLADYPDLLFTLRKAFGDAAAGNATVANTLSEVSSSAASSV